ncbi:MAG: hypothetical protein OEZ21_05195 [Candidatus Bathyarchaeota archaeon]|nr:hypothetical protein [Candidatus Bathyarchaeota archaeon]MDH5746336.1 hypothetical protein [Candidatus Bathyarchaeota archaeon]
MKKEEAKIEYAITSKELSIRKAARKFSRNGSHPNPQPQPIYRKVWPLCEMQTHEWKTRALLK